MIAPNGFKHVKEGQEDHKSSYDKGIAHGLTFGGPNVNAIPNKSRCCGDGH